MCAHPQCQPLPAFGTSQALFPVFPHPPLFVFLISGEGVVFSPVQRDLLAGSRSRVPSPAFQPVADASAGPDGPLGTMHPGLPGSVPSYTCYLS